MKRVRPRGVQTATVKQSAAASTSPWAARNSRQVVRFLRSGAGSRPALLAHVGDGAPRDLMTEVAEGTPNTGVAPLAVLGGHPDDEPADRVQDLSVLEFVIRPPLEAGPCPGSGRSNAHG